MSYLVLYYDFQIFASPLSKYSTSRAPGYRAFALQILNMYRVQEAMLQKVTF
jgi:hypothetical protein